MAQTIRTHVSDGTSVLFAVDFDLGYIRREFVYVYQGEHPDFETQLGYTWINSSQIQLDTPVPFGETFYIRRVIPRNEAVNNYEDGAVLKEKNLNNSYKQALMIQEELADGFLTTGSIAFQVNADIDMQGHRLLDLPDALLPQEPSTKSQLDTVQTVLTDKINTDVQQEATTRAQADIELQQVDTDLDNRITNEVQTLNSTITTVIATERDTSEERYINTTGDTMSGVLNVVDSTLPASAVPRQVIVSALDAMQRQLLDLLGVQTNIMDFGFVDVTPDEVEDYGLVTDVVTEIEDYGKINLW